jgi:iron complex outermembrane receptor protein
MAHGKATWLRQTAWIGLIAAAVAGPAMAQTAPQQAEEAVPAGREIATGLGDIIVTAQRRAENLQDVPVSVSALDAAGIERAFARDIKDVSSLSPNLVIDPILGNGTAAISIRGMQLNDVEKSFDPAVAVYLDGIYLASTTGALLQVWDAEAVEVLRGPQGTLFGRNTIGGLIHVRRAKPTGELGGKASITYGRFDQFDAKASIDLPKLGDVLSTKLSVMRLSGGGYFEDVSNTNNDGDTNFLGLTFQALLELGDRFEMSLIYDYMDDKTNTRPVTALTFRGQLFCLAGNEPGCGRPATDSRFHREGRSTVEQDAFLKTHAITANATYNLADGHDLVAVVGYRQTEEDAIQDFDGVSAFLFQTQRPQDQDQLSIELRYQGSWLEDSLKIVAGGYYWDSTYELRQRTTSPAFFGNPQISARPIFQQENQAYALFGQVDWTVFDRFTLTLGGRWTKEDKDARGRSRVFLGETELPGSTAFGDFPTGTPGYVPSFVNAAGQTIRVTGQASFKDFTPKVGLSYKFDNGLVFASYSEGFRSGGFNGRSTEPNSLGPYDPEKVKGFEFGTKTQWLDNRVQVNASLFFTKYDNKQEDVVFPDPTQVTVTVVENAASAQINGAELEFRAVPADGLTLGVTVGYLDAKFKDYIVPNIGGGVIDKSDFELRRAPKWTLALNGVYEYPLPNDATLVFTANYAYKSDYFIVANTLSSAAVNPGLVKSHGLLDLSVNYETEFWSLSLFGKNLTNESYFMHVLDVGTSYAATSATNPTPVVAFPGIWTFGTINPPRSWGIEARIKF